MELKEIGEKQVTDQFKKYLVNILVRWPYILGVFLVSLLVAYGFNYYQDPVYSIKARITTKKFSTTPTTPVPGLVDASFFTKGVTEIYEEIPTLKSRKRIEATVDRLDYRVSYFSVGLVKTVEILHGIGFDVIVDSLSETGYPFNIPIYYKQIDARSYKLQIDNAQWSDEVGDKPFLFGTPVKIGTVSFRIVNTNGKEPQSTTYYFMLNRRTDVVNRYLAKLEVDWVMKGSSMLDFTMESKLPTRDIEFFRKYYNVVEEMALQEKNETLDNTISFIDAQMKLVSDSLVYYQNLVDNIKVRNIQLNLGPEEVFAKFNELDLKEEELALNELYLNYLNTYFDKNRNSEVFAPSLNELNSELMQEWVSQYITDKLKDKAYKTEDNAQNPLINREDSLRRRLIKGIYESIESGHERNKAGMTQINKQKENIRATFKEFQEDFRALSQYQRLYALNLTLFDLLLKRRIEAAISKASATSDYKIIEAPAYSAKPIRPDKLLNFAIAGLLGLILPIGLFLYRDLTNPTVTDKDDLKNNLDIPLLGYVPHSPYEMITAIADHPRSLVTESFRAIRASLKYIENGKLEKGKVYLITSCVAGEGKTFCSINLAQSLVMSGKRTVLLGADLRKSSLKDYIKITHERGLSEYLAGITTLEDVLIKGEGYFPDYIYSGHVPPNPSELLASDRMKALVEHLQAGYDHIIIDTPPIGLVSDAMELLKLITVGFIIVRQDVTQKEGLRMINELYEEGKLSNFFTIFNDVKVGRKGKAFRYGFMYGLGYGGYGYGYYEEDNGKGRN
jgi:capsular exopolysaccharide synthesis family protein